MATDMRRIMVSITPELELELEQLKKQQFYNTTQADMFRYLISVGLKNIKTEKQK